MAKPDAATIKKIRADGLEAAKRMHQKYLALPKKDRDMACKCDKQNFVPFHDLMPKPLPTNHPDYPYGFYCSNCKKIYIYSLFIYVENRPLYRKLLKGKK